MASPDSSVGGRRPNYTSSQISDVPNAGAISTRLWAPGLNQGYAPQGLALSRGSILISTYNSTDTKVGRGPCRLFRVSRAGSVTGALDLPPSCGHAGGVATLPGGAVAVADTHMLFLVEDPFGRSPRIRAIRLGTGVLGSLATAAAGNLWLGSYEAGPGHLLGFPVSRLASLPDGGSLSPADATGSITLPPKAQGAAFDRRGDLWVTSSGKDWGLLHHLGPDGTPRGAAFTMPGGIEGVAVDGSGALWIVSEAGSRRWIGWHTFYPLIMRVTPARLR